MALRRLASLVHCDAWCRISYQKCVASTTRGANREEGGRDWSALAVFMGRAAPGRSVAARMRLRAYDQFSATKTSTSKSNELRRTLLTGA